MPPVFGNILLRQRPDFGSKKRESTRREFTVDARHTDEFTADLQTIIRSWNSLPQALKAAIVAIVRTGISQASTNQRVAARGILGINEGGKGGRGGWSGEEAGPQSGSVDKLRQASGPCRICRSAFYEASRLNAPTFGRG